MEPLSLLGEADCWSLSSESSLLECLQDLAASLASQTGQLQGRMDRLAVEVATAHTRLDTTHNNFKQLSNVKFIEARVYEDSEDVEEVKKELAAEEPSDEAVTGESLAAGLKLLQTAFDRVEIEDSDTEEEGAKMISVMQAKNPFHVRSLPAVLGTKAWLEDDKIGLVEEEAEEAEEESTDSSDEEVEKTGKEVSDYSQSDVEQPGARAQVKAPATVGKLASEQQSLSDFSDDDELFKPKAVAIGAEVTEQPNEDIDPEEEVEGVAVKKNDFSHELAKKIGLPQFATTVRDEEERWSSNDEADAADILTTPSRAKTLTKLQPVKKSLLFDSSDSDDDLFSSKPAKKKISKPTSPAQEVEKLPLLPPPSTKPQPALVAADMSKVAAPVEPVAKASPPPDEGVVTPPPLKATALVRKPLFGSSSSDDDDDIFADIKVKPVAGPVVESRDGGEDSEDLDDIFSGKSPKSVDTVEPVAVTEEASKAAKKPFGGISMFGDGFKPASVVPHKENSDGGASADVISDDDDIFAAKSSQPKPPILPPVSAKPKVTMNTFGDQDDSEDSDGLFSDVTVIKKTAGILKESSETSVPPQAPDQPPPSEELNVDTIQSTPATTKKPFGGISIFGDGFNPAGFAKATEEQTVPEKPAPSTAPSDLVDAPDMPESVKSEVLETLTKSRARGKAGRRPPSRAARKVAFKASEAVEVEESVGDGEEPPADEEIMIPRGVEDQHEAQDSAEIVQVKKPFGGISMFGAGLGPGNLPKSNPAVETSAPTGNSSDTTYNPLELEEAGGSAVASDTSPLIVQARSSEEEEEEEEGLFSGLGKPKVETQSGQPIPSPSIAGSEDDDDVMFAPKEKAKDEPAGPAAASSNNTTASNIFGFDDSDDDEDLFSNMATGTKPSLKPGSLADFLGDESDDDDLFSSLASKSAK